MSRRNILRIFDMFCGVNLILDVSMVVRLV